MNRIFQIENTLKATDHGSSQRLINNLLSIQINKFVIATSVIIGMEMTNK